VIIEKPSDGVRWNQFTKVNTYLVAEPFWSSHDERGIMGKQGAD